MSTINGYDSNSISSLFSSMGTSSTNSSSNGMLGINLNDFTTTSTLQRGVEQALALTNRAIVEVKS